jgi:hypothetical protein
VSFSNNSNIVRVNHIHDSQNDREIAKQLMYLREDIRKQDLNGQDAFAVKDGAEPTKRSPYVNDRYGLSKTKFFGSGEENAWKQVASEEKLRAEVQAPNLHLKKLDIF